MVNLSYLLKPIEFDRFFKAINKVVGGLTKNVKPSSSSLKVVNEVSQPTYFFIKTDSKIVKIIFDEVLFIEAMQKYIRIHTNDKKVTSLFSLSKIEEMLPTDQFIRIHRSYVISIDKVESVEGNMVKIDKHILPVSKRQKEGFMQLLKQKGLFF